MPPWVTMLASKLEPKQAKPMTMLASMLMPPWEPMLASKLVPKQTKPMTMQAAEGSQATTLVTRLSTELVAMLASLDARASTSVTVLTLVVT